MIVMEFIQAKQVGKCVRWLPSTKDMYKMLKITLISFDLDGARVLIKKRTLRKTLFNEIVQINYNLDSINKEADIT